jgi:hypothetical protein
MLKCIFVARASRRAASTIVSTYGNSTTLYRAATVRKRVSATYPIE